MDEPAKDAERRSDPHKRKHLNPQSSPNIQPLLRGNDVPENNEHHSGQSFSTTYQKYRGGCQKCRHERPYREGKTQPMRVQYDGCYEDRDEIHAEACQEEAKHQMRSNADQFQNGIDLSRQCYSSSR